MRPEELPGEMGLKLASSITMLPLITEEHIMPMGP